VRLSTAASLAPLGICFSGTAKNAVFFEKMVKTCAPRTTIRDSRGTPIWIKLLMIFSKNPLFRSLQSDLANAFHPTFQLKVQKRAGFMCLALARRDRAQT
jgi:hypothetical protein